MISLLKGIDNRCDSETIDKTLVVRQGYLHLPFMETIKTKYDFFCGIKIIAVTPELVPVTGTLAGCKMNVGTFHGK
jgi:hypothetical protein